VSRADDPLARALDALPPAATPPPFARVLAAVDRDAGRRLRVRVGLAVAAGVCLAVGAAVIARRGPDVPADVPRATARGWVGDAVTPDAFVVRRGTGFAPNFEGLRLGDDVEARDAGRIRLDGRVTLSFDAGARVTLTSAGEVEQTVGRVRYAVDHDSTDIRPEDPTQPAPRRFVVTAAGVRVADVGTRFTVDVAPPGEAPTTSASPAGAGPTSPRVLVTVEEGAVEITDASAGPSRGLRAGRGLAFVAGRPVGDEWPTDARPVLAIDVETTNPRATEPARCRVTLRNPTDAWLALPTPDDGALLVVEVVGADGVSRPVRVTEAMRLPPRTPSVIPPRGEVVVRVQFERTFASPGTYRLRAVYRPADAVEPPRSPEALLTVR
jgi:ferric-dicitrate binding protein FerR (iron transport regulator)